VIPGRLLEVQFLDRTVIPAAQDPGRLGRFIRASGWALAAGEEAR
jgi:hypothetical protein